MMNEVALLLFLCVMTVRKMIAKNSGYYILVILRL